MLLVRPYTTYTMLQKYRYKNFAGNQGKHQNFGPFLQIIGMKQKKKKSLRKIQNGQLKKLSFSTTPKS